jgi:hypothetical protein
LETSRKTVVTIQVLDDYKSLIADTKSDLQERLDTIDAKLSLMAVTTTMPPEEAAKDHRQFQEERDGTRLCLEICSKVSLHLEQVRRSVWIGEAAPAGVTMERTTSLDKLVSSRFTTAESLTSCEDILKAQSARLRDHLERSSQSSDEPELSKEQIAERQRIKNEYETTKMSLALCEEASQRADEKGTSYYEDIQLAEDTKQVIVSTIGDLISAKGITVGPRSINFMGQMSNESLQQLAHSVRNIPVSEDVSVDTKPGANMRFENRYGTGKAVRGGFS